MLALQVDSAPSPDDEVLRRLDAVTLPQIIECLDPRPVAVLKMRFGRGPEPRAICVRLRVSEQRLESPGNRRTRASRPSSSTDSRTRTDADDPLDPVTSVAPSTFLGSTQRWTADQGPDPGRCPDANRRALGQHRSHTIIAYQNQERHALSNAVRADQA
jgi:hypothetical protein